MFPPKKTGRKGSDAVRRILNSRYYKTGEICGEKVDPLIDC
jgi:hypothetical protein